MGFQLFTKSGTFNPISAGLNVGDLITVVVVGGGGGGGLTAYGQTSSSSSGTSISGTGGTGGTSSFGSFATAKGGSGGAPRANTPNASQGAYVVNSTQGGAPGWIPGLMMGGYMGILTLDELCTMEMISATSTSASYVKKFKYNPLRGGLPCSEIEETRVVSEPPESFAMLQLLGPALGESQSGFWSVQSVFYPWRIAGGCGWAGHNDYDSTSEAERMRGIPTGGAGYGAGGAGSGDGYTSNGSSGDGCPRVNYGGNGGNSGEVILVQVQLSSLSNIAVTVGGGGAGAYVTTATAYGKLLAGNGANGGAGTYGSNSGYSNRGGYDSTPGGHGNVGVAGANGGGGGAGGCVAVFW